MKHQLPSSFWSATFLLAISLLGAIAGNFLPGAARAQMQPPPINGNVYQNQAGLAQQSGPENIMILLDSSYSMSEPIGGRGSESKMMAAKRTVMEVLQSVSPNVRVGLRVYGNSSNQFASCRATSVLAPLGENNRTLIGAKLIGVHPQGATPISYSVQHALDEDFRNVNGKRTIILISDGIETCGEDPCNLAVRMQQMGANVKINVVGLGLQDYDAVKQLKCVALGTKGKYYTANTAAELTDSLNNAMAVETHVQATILPAVPASGRASSPINPAMGAVPTAGQPASKPYEDKLLPAAVPIKPNNR